MNAIPRPDEPAGVKSERVNQLHALARNPHPHVAAAASQAITKIAGGHPAKPLLDEVRILRQAVDFRRKYPPLSGVPVAAAQTVRLGRYLDGLSEDALQLELAGLRALWGSDDVELERAYALNDRLNSVVEEWQIAKGDKLLDALAPKLSIMTLAHWDALGENLAQIAAAIREATKTSRDND